MEVKGPFSYETFSGKYEEPNFNFFQNCLVAVSTYRKRVLFKVK